MSKSCNNTRLNSRRRPRRSASSRMTNSSWYKRILASVNNFTSLKLNSREKELLLPIRKRSRGSRKTKWFRFSRGITICLWKNTRYLEIEMRASSRENGCWEGKPAYTTRSRLTLTSCLRVTSSFKRATRNKEIQRKFLMLSSERLKRMSEVRMRHTRP